MNDRYSYPWAIRRKNHTNKRPEDHHVLWRFRSSRGGRVAPGYSIHQALHRQENPCARQISGGNFAEVVGTPPRSRTGDQRDATLLVSRQTQWLSWAHDGSQPRLLLARQHVSASREAILGRWLRCRWRLLHVNSSVELGNSGRMTDDDAVLVRKSLLADKEPRRDPTATRQDLPCLQPMRTAILALKKKGQRNWDKDTKRYQTKGRSQCVHTFPDNNELWSVQFVVVDEVKQVGKDDLMEWFWQAEPSKYWECAQCVKMCLIAWKTLKKCAWERVSVYISRSNRHCSIVDPNCVCFL